MMSAVLQLLYNISQETAPDRKQAILDFCVAAYPDIRPWQVESACKGASDVYYSYLSQLLHPMDGHDSARRDSVLVKVRNCRVRENCVLRAAESFVFGIF